MAKVDLLLVSGITASDGSIVASGATLKFDAEFLAGSTNIRIMPKLYRSRELFESGYTNIQLSEELIPNDFILELSEEEYYQLTPLELYEKVGFKLNFMLVGEYFKIKITE